MRVVNKIKKWRQRLFQMLTLWRHYSIPPTNPTDRLKTNLVVDKVSSSRSSRWTNGVVKLKSPICSVLCFVLVLRQRCFTGSYLLDRQRQGSSLYGQPADWSGNTRPGWKPQRPPWYRGLPPAPTATRCVCVFVSAWLLTRRHFSLLTATVRAESHLCDQSFSVVPCRPRRMKKWWRDLWLW